MTLAQFYRRCFWLPYLVPVVILICAGPPRFEDIPRAVTMVMPSGGIQYILFHGWMLYRTRHMSGEEIKRKSWRYALAFAGLLSLYFLLFCIFVLGFPAAHMYFLVVGMLALAGAITIISLICVAVAHGLEKLFRGMGKIESDAQP